VSARRSHAGGERTLNAFGRMSATSNSAVAALLLGFSALATIACGQAWSGPQGSAGARYEIRLTPAEFSLLTDAAQRGLSAQGGRAEFGVQLQRAATDLEWTITVKELPVMEAWRVWLAAKAADMVSAADFDKLSDAAKKDFGTLKSVIAKLDEAKSHPIWDTVTFAGTLAGTDRGVNIRNDAYSFKLTGQLLESLRSQIGKPMVVTGHMKAGDEIEVARFVERRANTVDLFAMSQCPFAKRAESAIITFLRNAAAQGGQAPQLDVHYILYKRQVGGQDTFTSMHGEEEINEDLVQIVIRDKFQKSFMEYLLQRAKSDMPWQQVAKDAGMDDAAVAAIDAEVKANREALLKREYEYVAQTYLVYDGSPTYVWEGVRLSDIRQAKPFAALDVTKEACHGL